MVIFKRDKPEEKPDEIDLEIEELRKRVAESGMPQKARKAALSEIDKMERSSPSSAEYTISLNYLEYLLDLPWNRYTSDNLDIKRAEKILDQEHYGLKEVKDRILEYLAVRIIKQSRRYRILVVDDEVRTRKNLDHVLTKEGYEVYTAANGEQALDVLHEKPVDLLVTDLKMDRIDGMELLQRARQDDPSVQVIVITGYATVPSAIEAMKKGTFHYITKPFKLEEIRSSVKAALAPKMKRLAARGPILCFSGPPGTGKTSLGMSIAKSLEKRFIRISLAGVRDEAEIRGHRKSYAGAMPGRIIQEIRRADACNPVFMLDEIDKLGADFKGDPASALLEVLDPQQNSQFVDHYIDVPFDLSSVMFIATANIVDHIPAPLRDRFEVIHLSGYTDEEKEQIAKKYLIPRAIQDAGIDENPPLFEDGAVGKIIREYTREAGLRELSRRIDAVCRKIARNRLDTGKSSPVRVSADMIERFLGPRKYRFEVADANDRVGIATGLAWAESGGAIVFIEATKMKGKSNLILTGSLGDVMKESAQAALSYIRSNAARLGIDPGFFEEMDLHIHVPAGAIPKDGPSAGLAIGVALLSLLMDKPARHEIAYTGEITLSGRILPVGGVREKILAALRAGVKTVVIPRENDVDLRNLPGSVAKAIEILPVSHFDEITGRVLAG